MSIVCGMTGWWPMSVYLKKKRSYNLVGWWSVDFLLIEMKTLLILKEKSHLYLFIHSSAIWCVLEFHGLYRSWGCKELDTTERLSFSLSLYRVLGSMDSTEREQTWSFPMSLWSRISHKWNHTICTLLAFLKPTMVFLQLSMVLHVPPSFLSSVVSLYVVVSQLADPSTCWWMFGLFLVWGVWIRLWWSFMAKLFCAHCAHFSWLCTWE